MIKMNQFTDEEFKEIVKDSKTYLEISQKIGYTSIAGDAFEQIKKRIKDLGINTSHISRKGIQNQVRNEENIFIKDSTASQATLRRWYIKGEYSPYVCSICGLKPEWQGKPLTLILDHINGQNHDDRLENLRWVCPNCNQQLPTTGSQKRKNPEEEHCNFCVDCGAKISEKAVRCRSCNSKFIKENSTIPVSREELKKLVREKSFTEIGKMYCYSDKSISKWCKKYNMPYLKREINKMSDEEWEKV